MVIAILNHPVEMVHHTPKKISIKTQIILDHSHLIIIEMATVHNVHSHRIALETFETTLTHY